LRRALAAKPGLADLPGWNSQALPPEIDESRKAMSRLISNGSMTACESNVVFRHEIPQVDKKFGSWYDTDHSV